MYAFEKEVKKYLHKSLRIFLESKVTRILYEDGRVTGIEIIKNYEKLTLKGKSVILATGGYANDRQSDSLL